METVIIQKMVRNQYKKKLQRFFCKSFLLFRRYQFLYNHLDKKDVDRANNNQNCKEIQIYNNL